jgi:hypothetical protein
MAADVVVCANPQCKVAETGKCLEGLEVSQCPQFGKTPTASLAAEVSQSAIPVNSGEKLASLTAEDVLRAGPGKVIAIIGPIEAGKTTLIASTYDLFQKGAINKIQFCGSRTMIALEKACHNSRAASLRERAHMARTKLGTFGYYHMHVSQGLDHTKTHFLLADRAGEEYLTAASSPSLLRDFPEVQRADVVTVLLDGERLLTQDTRHNARAALMQVIQALFESLPRMGKQRLAIVLTKYDEILRAGQAGELAKRDFEAAVASIRKSFGGRFAGIESFIVAASPAHDVLAFGYGMPELLEYWIEDFRAGHAELNYQPELLRAMDRILVE